MSNMPSGRAAMAARLSPSISEIVVEDRRGVEIVEAHAPAEATVRDGRRGAALPRG